MFRIMLIAVALVVSSCSATKRMNESHENENLIIYYEPGAGNGELLKAAKRYGSEVLYVYQNINGIAVTVPRDKTVTDAMKYYGKIKGVLSVTQDRKLQLD